MNNITFPLTKRTRSSAVDDLQHALKYLLGKNVFPLPGNGWRVLQERVQLERGKLSYGLSTRQVVAMFQTENQLTVTGEVDQPTAQRINATLEELGAFIAPEPNPQRLVSGQVRRQDMTPYKGGRVRAFHETSQGAIRLGEDITDADGSYTIHYEPLPGTTGINLSVSVTDDQDRHLTSSKVFGDAKPLETIDLTLPGSIRPTAQRVIEGRILLEHGTPAEGLILRLYRQDFGRDRLLIHETVTSAGGFYTLPYEVSGQTTASLSVFAVDPAGAEKPLSRTIHGLGTEQATLVNLVAPKELQPMAPEYARLSADVKPHIGEMIALANVRENKDRQDLTVLNGVTGWDARLLALAASAAKLGADPDVGLSQEVLYGLFRAGLPSDKLQLAQLNGETVGQTLGKARSAGIINLTEAQLAEAKTRFQNFALQTALASQTPGSLSTYGQMLNSSGLGEAALSNFAQVYLNHRSGDPEDLWEQATAAGVAPEDIEVLQQQGKLAFLTLNNHEMTARLQADLAITDPVQLVAQDFYRADKWADEVRGLAGNDVQRLGQLIPPAYDGETVEERLNSYAGDMARKVRLSYPTQVIGHMVEQSSDPFKLGASRDSTATFLNRAADKGFRLGETPVETFLRDHADVLEGLDANESALAVENARALHRVYQITPSNEAMTTLMTMGLTSAYDVVAVSKEVFLDRARAELLPLDQAELIYRKARQVTSVTYNVFAIAKTLDSQPPVYGLSAPAQAKETAKNELIKQFPTLESLFGSMDFCECDHCQSVLSPAAYLVDLLQFIDAEPAVWANFLADWKNKHNNQAYTVKYKKPYDALIERRPDIPHIPLTCENTHTALPYIDVVNEILEYYVANNKLDANAAHDTGAATTAELLAEPQNVIAEAYERLRQAQYPLNLPFDLWLETVRKFSEYFETPLWQLLETLRPGNELFVPSQTYDRAAIFIESLGLSPSEYAIFTNPVPLNTWHALYGYATAAEATTVSTDATSGQRIDLNSAKALSRRLGVTYKELLEIVRTGFVNPQLAEFGILNKLGVEIQDVLFYAQHRAFYDVNKDLLGKDRDTLSIADKQRFDALTKDGWERLDEVDAFEKRLINVSEEFQASGFDAKASLNTALQNNAFDGVLLLVDQDAGCNFDLTTLRYASGAAADAIAFLKINLFVRLWRKLGWTIEETDRALQTFIPRNTPFDAAHLNRQPLRTALIYMAHLKRLNEQVSLGKQSRLKLLTLWSQMATSGKNPLYAQLFLTRGVLKSDPVFDDAMGNHLSSAGLAARAQSRKHEVSRGDVAQVDMINPAAFVGNPKIILDYDSVLNVQHLSYQGVLTDAEKAILEGLNPSPLLASMLDEVQEKAAEFSLIKGHFLGLQGSLGMTAAEIERVIVDDSKSLSTAVLSLDNVSLLYRYGLLARALKLTVRELIALKQLSGLDPFKPLGPDPLTSLAEDNPFVETLRFVEVAGQVKDSGLKIEDLEYLLRHSFDQTGKYRPDTAATLVLIKALGDGIRAIRTEHAVPADSQATSEEVLRQKLGLALPLDVVARFLNMVNGTVEFTATVTGVPPANKLVAATFADEPSIRQVSYNPTRQEQKLTFRGVLFVTQKDDLNDRFSLGAFADLLDDVQKQARSFFDNNLKSQQLRLEDEAGFLDDSDFETLFEPLKLLLKILAGDTQQQIDDKLIQNENIERENQTTLQARRNRVAAAFLPLLQQRLIRQLIVETMTAHTGADPALVESLLTDARLLSKPQSGLPQTLLTTLNAVAERGLTARVFDGLGNALGSATFLDADTGMKDKNGNALKPSLANSASFVGYLEVPAPGAYRFYVAFDRPGARAQLRFDHLPEPLLDHTATNDIKEASQHLELKPGTLYRFTLDVKELNGGDVRVMVQGETLPKASLAQLGLYPQAVVESAEQSLLLLRKVLQLSQTLNLSERELRYLLTNAADFGNVDLSKLPTRASDDSLAGAKALFGQFLRLAGYARLKRDLAEGTDDLIGVFETSAVEGAYPQIAKLMRRQEADVKAAALALFASPSFKNELALERLWELLQVVARFGVPVSSLMNWTRIVSPASTANQRFAIARNLKEAIKARFEPEIWQRVAQPIFDALRQRQRDALVAHVMNQHGFARMEQLYEYFLIDPGMEPVVQTSRIRLAISSLQLFIHRCLLNLEKQVHPSVINSKQWEWMKRYRVWEANRKIFLFPENWLEPEFRDDKTHLFRELEGNLLEGDVSSDLVEDAFLKYLKKLEELARLDIVCMHLDDDPDPNLNILHVIGRTYSTPHKYFYRRYAQQMWTPWEPVTAEIEGDHLAPVVWRDRLYLFWVTFMDKPDANAQPGTSTQNQKLADATLAGLVSDVKKAGGTKQVDMQLHWSEYLEGEWSPSESGAFVTAAARPSDSQTFTIPITVPLNFDYKSVFVHVSKEPFEDGAERGVYIHLGGKINQSFYLAGRNSKPERTRYSNPPANPYSTNDVLASRYEGTGPLTVRYKRRITTETGKPPVETVETPAILVLGGKHTLLPCDNDITLGSAEIASLVKPLFYQDDTHTLFMEPTLTERTINEWREWVIQLPEPRLELNVIDVVPEVPRFPDFVDLGRPIGQIDPGSILEVKQERDWLVNPGTGLLFDGELIGPSGLSGVAVLTSSDLTNAIGKGGVVLNTHAGSDVATDGTVIATDSSALERSGLTLGVGGLNVVGSGGLNNGMLENFRRSFGSERIS